MNISLKKIELARAKAIMDTKEMLASAKVPRGTWCSVVRKKTASPKTAGKIARALGVDVTEILEDA